MDVYEKQIAAILPPCKDCRTVKVFIDRVTNKSILCGCKCGWGGLNPKEWSKKHTGQVPESGGAWTQRRL